MSGIFSVQATFDSNFSQTSFSAPVGDDVALAIFGGFMLFFLFIVLLFYVYHAVTLQIIAKKTGTENGWLAWVPILNLVLMLQIAKKPLWWLLLFLLPMVNVIFAAIVWIEIAKSLNKSEWWGILILVPVVNIIVPGYLAFSSDGTSGVVMASAESGTQEVNDDGTKVTDKAEESLGENKREGV